MWWDEHPQQGCVVCIDVTQHQMHALIFAKNLVYKR